MPGGFAHVLDRRLLVASPLSCPAGRSCYATLIHRGNVSTVRACSGRPGRRKDSAATRTGNNRLWGLID